MLALNGPAPLPGDFSVNTSRDEPQQGDYDSLTSLERQLERLRGQVRPGEMIRLFDRAGHEFHFRRDDAYEFGFGLVPHELPRLNPR